MCSSMCLVKPCLAPNSFVTFQTDQFLVSSDTFLGKHHKLILKETNFVWDIFSLKSEHESNMLISVVRFTNSMQNFLRCNKYLTSGENENDIQNDSTKLLTNEGRQLPCL